MIPLIVILVSVIIVNLIIIILDAKLTNKEILEKLKEKQKELKEAKNDKEIKKILNEISELYSKIMPKQMLLLTANFVVIIGVLYILNSLYQNQIIIPLPFKVPFTNRYGIGPAGTFILFSLVLSPLLKKLINKIPKFRKWLGEK